MDQILTNDELERQNISNFCLFDSLHNHFPAIRLLISALVHQIVTIYLIHLVLTNVLNFK